jgi:putative protease
VGWRVSRSSHPQLTEQARNSYQAVPIAAGTKRIRVDAIVAGGLGTPLLLTLSAAGLSVTVESEIELTRATKRPLDDVMLREQLGRMGETEFALASLDSAALEPGLFVPVSQVNHLRQRAVEQLAHQLAAEDVEGLARFRSEVREVQDSLVSGAPAHEHETAGVAVLCAEVFNLTDAQLAADAGADEIVFDPFLRHPMPPLAQVRKLADLLADGGRVLRIRTPTIVRPQDRRLLEKWLAMRLPMQTGHLGLLWELGRDGVNVTGDYALNCFNQFTAAEYFRRGATSLVLSIELTTSEIASLVAPWGGRGFEAVIYGRPEGMTIEHCVLSAAFDREPTTCRDLCVQKHPGVTLVDPTGYSFPVATDSDCRNRLLHSRPIDASAFVPALWSSGIRRYKMLLNMPDLPVRDLVSGYRELLQSLAGGTAPGTALLREIIGGEYTRGHYARAV